MSRTYRKPTTSGGMRKSDYLTNKQVFKKFVRDGTRTRSSSSCEHGGDCPHCYRDRNIDKIKTELYFEDDIKDIL